MTATNIVLAEVLSERKAQDAKWGEQNHPNGTGPHHELLDDIGAYPGIDNSELAEAARDRTDALAGVGRCTYAHILTEEYAEAMAEEDPERLRRELVQIAAVAVAWVEKIDRDAA